ncbi:MobH family relaxase [uncultured Pseudacidovorax sp.]|uniref:MobH family relaxase n=1 Tax=uncultured Pseudacidovorax sp. TaxID=679313 RepID=UPI0025DD6A84|nr:MobH family relaxase [uncultured Pseudacidovorax sp.]
MAVSEATKALQGILGRVSSLLRGRSATQPSRESTVPASSSPPAVIEIAGSQPNWLRVLSGDQLLQLVRAQKALDEIERKSRLAKAVFERDCLAPLRRYAEFVQLMPASEAHHHAHVGGLLTHTIEMLLAAMTWRNGSMLPAGAPIEAIDAQRDEWTMVVFYAALLHDIGKPLTDLRISWRCKDTADGVRWPPMAGSLPELTRGRKSPEYLVQFAPKVERNYGAHSRSAVMLLQRIASQEALAMLAQQPQAYEALSRYLSGEDRESLVAKIVMNADQASARHALTNGSRARFATAQATPLIDLMMRSLQAMLRAGTVLPINRSGAAGWVYEGSIWFVAKRVADATRDWIKKHAPDEAVPGDTKNDRLFDTWQDYACITPNPSTGQAIWYVVVHGAAAADADGQQGEAEPAENTYSHSLTMLRFPLEKLYQSPAEYPAAMRGRIEVLDKRKAAGDGSAQVDAEAAIPEGDELLLSNEEECLPQPSVASTSRSAAAPSGEDARDAATAVTQPAHGAASTAGPEGAGKARPSRAPVAGPTIRAPSFNRPPKESAKAGGGKADGSVKQRAPADAPAASATEQSDPKRTATRADRDAAGPMSAEAAYLLDDAEDIADLVHTAAGTRTSVAARAESDAPAMPVNPGAALPEEGHANGPANAGAPKRLSGRGKQPLLPAGSSGTIDAARRPPPLLRGGAPAAPTLSVKQRLAMPISGERPMLLQEAEADFVGRAAAQQPVAQPGPVVLTPTLPEISSAHAKPAPEPSEQAIAFLTWLQRGLATGEMRFNETGAAVHFVAEGMALVSPLIFKLFAATVKRENEVAEFAILVQREVTKAGWHLMGPAGKNIVQYAVVGRGGALVAKLATVVLLDPVRFVMPVPPPNLALRLDRGS